MDPRIWGPEVWSMIHSMAWMCDTTGADFSTFIIALQKVLPCPVCADHFKKLLAEHPPSSPYFLWSVTAHNTVRKKNNNELLEYNVAEMREKLKQNSPFTSHGLLRTLLLLTNFSSDISYTRELFASIERIFTQSKNQVVLPRVNLDIQDCRVPIEVFSKYNSLK
jgi:hypothetical protein